ncbi:Gfo/Idh/MocA family protein [Halosimplex amylolyticum]|uniref:Gfo/Idh/MocA family protein n=1 Tax=Halosimplex amylolyticum TaxID=3396616 RepID=UPI003F5797D1
MPIPSLLVGAGNRGKYHALSMDQNEQFDLLGVCDVDSDRARDVAALFDVPSVFTDIKNAMEEVGPDFVATSLPPSVNREVTEAVLSAEPEVVLIEKPIAPTYEDVAALENAIGARDTDVVVCHEYVYTKEAQALKEWVDSGEIGKPLRIVVSTQGRLPSTGTHILHLVDWLVGRSPEVVRAFVGGDVEVVSYPELVEPDDAVLELNYGGDTDLRAFVHAGPGGQTVPVHEGAGVLEARIDVIGTEGRAEAVISSHATVIGDNGHQETVRARDAGDNWLEPYRELELDIIGTDRPWEWGYLVGYATERLYEDVPPLVTETDATHPANYGSAADAHLTIDTALRSMLDGQEVIPSPSTTESTTAERLQRWADDR